MPSPWPSPWAKSSPQAGARRSARGRPRPRLARPAWARRLEPGQLSPPGRRRTSGRARPAASPVANVRCSPSCSRRFSRPRRRRRPGPARSPRRRGLACGSAPFGPPATIGGNAHASAPSSRIVARSTRRARFSVRPTKRCSARRSKVSFVIAAARRIASSSPGSLTARIPLQQLRRRHCLDPAGVDRRPRRVRQVLRLERDPLRQQLRQPLNRPRGISTTSIPVALRLLEVAEVGEDPHPVGLDEHGRVRAVQAGQPQDVDRLRDEQRRVDRRAASTRSALRRATASLIAASVVAFGSTYGLRFVPGTRAPRGSRPAPCRSPASRRGRRSPSGAATPRAPRCSRGAPRRPAR